MVPLENLYYHIIIVRCILSTEMHLSNKARREFGGKNEPTQEVWNKLCIKERERAFVAVYHYSTALAGSTMRQVA